MKYKISWISFGFLIYIIFMMETQFVYSQDISIKQLVDLEKLEQILGGNWEKKKSVKIESIKDFEWNSDSELSKRWLNSIKRYNVASIGIFSYSYHADNSDVKILQVCKFESSKDAEVFRKNRFEKTYPKHKYVKTSSGNFDIYDINTTLQQLESIEEFKRIVFNNQYMIACRQLKEGSLHKQIINECINLNLLNNGDQVGLADRSSP